MSNENNNHKEDASFVGTINAAPILNSATYSLNLKIKGLFVKRTIYQVVARKLVRTQTTKLNVWNTYSNKVVAEFDNLIEAEETLNDLCEFELTERNNR